MNNFLWPFNQNEELHKKINEYQKDVDALSRENRRLLVQNRSLRAHLQNVRDAVELATATSDQEGAENV